MSTATQSDIEKEFQELIRQVSADVLERSVSKAMLDSSKTIYEQVPLMDGLINELSHISTNLGFSSKKLSEEINRDYEHKEEVLYNFQKIEDHQKSILNQLSLDIKKNVEEEIKRYDLQKKLIESANKNILLEIRKNIDLTQENIKVSHLSKKLVIWALSISIVSLGALVYFILMISDL